MHNLSLHFVRMGSWRRARLRKEYRREADDLEIRLRASLPSSLTSSLAPSAVDARRGFESAARGRSFSTRFHDPFVPDIRDTYDRTYPLLPYRPPLRSLSFRSRWFADFQSVETGTFKFNNVTGYFSSFGIKCE